MLSSPGLVSVFNVREPEKPVMTKLGLPPSWRVHVRTQPGRKRWWEKCQGWWSQLKVRMMGRSKIGMRVYSHACERTWRVRLEKKVNTFKETGENWRELVEVGQEWIFRRKGHPKSTSTFIQTFGNFSFTSFASNLDCIHESFLIESYVVLTFKNLRTGLKLKSPLLRCRSITHIFTVQVAWHHRFTNLL